MPDRKPPPDPDAARALIVRAVALHDLERHADALALYAQAIALAPGDAMAWCNQGITLLVLGRHGEALERCDRAIALDPGYAAAHLNRARALQGLGRHADALASYDAAILLEPASAHAHNDRGTVLENLQRYDEAVASYAAAAALDPGDAVARFNQGNAAMALGRLEVAIDCYDAAIGRDAGHVAAHLNRGTALLNLGRYAEALASYDRVTVLAPDHSDGFYNQGISLRRLGRHGDALARFDRALGLRPDHVDALVNRGNALKALRRHGEARASYDLAIAFSRNSAVARLNKAELVLAQGDFAEGWPLYESRWELDEVRAWAGSVAHPRWDGAPPGAGKRLLLQAEQGLGDTLQFCRYALLLAERGACVTLEVPRSLHRLLASLERNGVTVAARGDALPVCDLLCPLMSVPGLVGTTVDTIPAPVPYLRAEADRVAQWRARLPSVGLRVGVVWQGNPAGAVDHGRSAPLAAFAPLAHVPGLHLVSLQKHHGLAQLESLPEGMTVATLGEDLDSGADAFVDAAAMMMSLDLVISTDTAIVHLAGALGRPVWVALQAVPHWTWMIDRADSPWYPSARLYRQGAEGDWHGVFERMARDLSNLERR